VYRNSNVYLNGKLLGNHPFAYTGFSYDLTGLVHTDGVTEDVIAVSAADQQPRQPLVLRRTASSANVYWSPPGRSTWRGTAPS